jgi:hypothetical protein
MQFAIEQPIAAPPGSVAAAYADPDFYSTLVDLPNLGTPEVLSHQVDGDAVQLRIRYRLVRDLSAAVRAVVDPKKLTWVEVSTHRVQDREVTFHVEPDNYADRFQGSGSYAFDASGDGDGTVRHGTGNVTIRMRLIGGRVEQAIVAELQAHLAEEVPFVERWVAQHGG